MWANRILLVWKKSGAGIGGGAVTSSRSSRSPPPAEVGINYDYEGGADWEIKFNFLKKHLKLEGAVSESR